MRNKIVAIGSLMSLLGMHSALAEIKVLKTTAGKERNIASVGSVVPVFTIFKVQPKEGCPVTEVSHFLYKPNEVVLVAVDCPQNEYILQFRDKDEDVQIGRSIQPGTKLRLIPNDDGTGLMGIALQK